MGLRPAIVRHALAVAEGLPSLNTRLAPIMYNAPRLRRAFMLRINDEAPNFTAETSQGTINFHEWMGDGWAILFSHPKDFTPVCTTELGYMAGLQPEFEKRNCKIIGLSVDPVTSHSKWAADIEETQGHKVNYPMIGDPRTQNGQALRHAARRTPATPATAAPPPTTPPCAPCSSSALTRKSS